MLGCSFVEQPLIHQDVGNFMCIIDDFTQRYLGNDVLTIYMDNVLCAQGTTTSLRNPPTCGGLMQPEKQPTRQNNKQQRKAIHTVFNDVRQHAYVLGAREREILLIQQSIQTNIEGTFQRDS